MVMEDNIIRVEDQTVQAVPPVAQAVPQVVQVAPQVVQAAPQVVPVAPQAAQAAIRRTTTTATIEQGETTKTNPGQHILHGTNRFSYIRRVEFVSCQKIFSRASRETEEKRTEYP